MVGMGGRGRSVLLLGLGLLLLRLAVVLEVVFVSRLVPIGTI